MTHSIIVHRAALAAALALPFALLTAAPATAATVTVTTWGDLQAAFAVDGDTVVLGADITAPANQNLAVDAGESITLDLGGYALTVTDPNNSSAAIHVPGTADLTIAASGGGILTATGGGDGAGIGGGSGTHGGSVTITGGTINATGGARGSGIGGGFNSTGGPVTITGGTVTATGGGDHAGISVSAFLGGVISITGGTVIATGGQGAAGMGGDFSQDGSTITITGGDVAAVGGFRGAGIGGGANGDGGTVTITGGTVSATGGDGVVAGDGAAGIGGGDGGDLPGTLDVQGTPDAGAATDGGNPNAAPITNSVEPAGVGYAATTSTVGTGGQLDLRFHYLVTLDPSGGTGPTSVTVNDGDMLTAPTEPSRDGYAFAGWTLDGSAYDFATAVAGPITLTATWASVLAATGVGGELLLGIAGVLLIAGLVLVLLRRRTKA